MDNDAFTIRAAVPGDIPALSGIFCEDDEYYSAALPDIFAKPASAAETDSHFNAYIGSGSAAMFVAESRGALAGYITMTISEAPASPLLTPRTFAKIRNIAVGAAWRRRGIGRALVDRAMRWAGERGVRDFELDVYEFNSGAVAFYESLGFSPLRKTMRLKSKDE